MSGRHPRAQDVYDRLIASAVLDADDMKLRASEEVVRLALNGVVIPDDVFLEAERRVFPRMIARTGSIFLLSPEDTDAVTAASEFSSAELPPMPFPRMWIEVWNSEEAAPQVFTTLYDWTGDEIQPCAYALNEVRQGMEWLVYCMANVLSRADGSETLGLDTFMWRLIGREHEDWPPEHDGEELVCAKVETHLGNAIKQLDEEHQQKLRDVMELPVWMVHAITALGTEYLPHAFSRPARRRLQRRFSIDSPRLYFVDMRGGDEDDFSGGSGVRSYYHRWLVRGHYRLHAEGRYELPRGRCTWVRPYIKGPAGAPWKGRPIHV